MKKRYRWLLSALVLAGVASAVGLILDWAYPLPQPAPPSVRVLAKDGQLLRAFPAPDETWRYPAQVDSVAPVFLEQLLAYEDRAFYYHPGVNPLAIARAAWQNLMAGEVVSGGSTLSMQVAGLLDPYPRTLRGKVKQVLRTLQLEWHYSKPEILELYLNLAPYGGMLSGIEAASQHYFGKPSLELSDAEAALLTVLPQRPSEWRPDRYPQRARAARDKVLKRMHALGLWDINRVDEALQENVAALPPRSPVLAPLLARRLRQECSECLTIETLIDADLQRDLEALVETYRQRLNEHQSLAVMVMRNDDLSVRAYVGAAEFGAAQRYGHVDMTRALRSPGSTLKPFAYAQALDQGLVHSHSMLLDTPRYGLDYRPHNFTGGFAGPVTVKDALQRSLNLPVVQLVEHLGAESFLAGMRNGGLHLQLPGSGEPSSALVLGGAGTSLESLLGAYSSFGRAGMAGTPRLLASNPETSRWMSSPAAAWITWRILAQDPWRALGALGQREWSLAWKTGTSYGFRDTWAMGVDSNWTLGVWVGRPDGNPSPGESGRSLAAPLLFRVYERLGQIDAAVPRPNGVEQGEICWPLGSRATHNANEGDNCMQSHQAWLLNGAAPLTLPQKPGITMLGLLRRVQIDPETGYRFLPGCGQEVVQPVTRQLALWPQQAEPWVRPEWRRRARLPAVVPACEAALGLAEPVKIIGVENGSLLWLPAGRDALELDLKLVGAAGSVNWYLDGRPLPAGGMNRQTLELSRAGQFRVSAVDSAGNVDSIEFSFRLQQPSP